MPVVLVALIVSPAIVAFPLYEGTAIPTYNSGNNSNLGPQIPSRVSIPSNISAVMQRVAATVGTQRLIELPLQAGVTSMTSPATYVSAVDYLQLLSGTNTISGFTNGIGPQTSLLYTEINEIILDNYLHDEGSWYHWVTFGVPTQNICGLLSILDSPYILVVPNVPDLPVNSISPYVNYTMIVQFLQNQSNVRFLFSQDSFQMYQCDTEFSPVTAATPVGTFAPNTDSIVVNGTSGIPWSQFNSTGSGSTPVGFDNGVLLKSNGGQETLLVGPPLSLNVSTADYHYLQMNLQPVNDSLSFYYVYNPNASAVGWAHGILPLYSGTPNNAYQIASQGSTLLTFSTRISYLPWLGTGLVPRFAGLYIGLTPSSNLPNGSLFGFRLTSLTFTNQTDTSDVVAYSLTQNPMAAFLLSNLSVVGPSRDGWALPTDLTTKANSPTSFTVNVDGAHGAFLLLLSESFSLDWQIQLNRGPLGGGVESGPFMANTFENAWYINGTGNFTITISFPLQSLVFVFGVVTLTAVTLEACWIVLALVRRRHRLGRTNHPEPLGPN